MELTSRKIERESITSNEALTEDSKTELRDFILKRYVNSTSRHPSDVLYIIDNLNQYFKLAEEFGIAVQRLFCTNYPYLLKADEICIEDLNRYTFYEIIIQPDSWVVNELSMKKEQKTYTIYNVTVRRTLDAYVSVAFDTEDGVAASYEIDEILSNCDWDDFDWAENESEILHFCEEDSEVSYDKAYYDYEVVNRDDIEEYKNDEECDEE